MPGWSFPGHPRRLSLVGAASAAKQTVQQIAGSAMIPAAQASRLTPLLQVAGKAPAEHGSALPHLIHSSWTKYHHVLQRPMRQGLPRLIHSLCRQQNTACVDSAKQVEPSHARLELSGASKAAFACGGGVSGEADGPTDCRQRHDSSSPSFAAYAAPTGRREGPAEHGSALRDSSTAHGQNITIFCRGPWSKGCRALSTACVGSRAQPVWIARNR